MRNCPSCGEQLVEDATGEPHCPRCADQNAAGEHRDAEAASPRPAGLWKLMSKGAAAPAEESAVSETSASETDVADGSIVDTDPETTEAKPASPKGLWSLMNAGAPIDEAAGRAPKLPALPEDETEPVETATLRTPRSADVEDVHKPPADDDLEQDDIDTSEFDDPEPEDEPADDAEFEPADRPSRSRGAVLSLMLGLAAVPASLLSLFPQFWMRIPTTVFGFSALIIGYLALSEIRRSRGKQIGKSLAMIGMSAGTIAMFLGPFLVTQYGEKFRRDLARRETGENLEQVGSALTAYKAEHRHFPPGSRHVVGKDGVDVALHGWQAMLLPYLGEDAAEIHGAIDFALPYNNEVNRPAMKRDVPAFFAAGGDRSKAGNGFAVSHFVALGGQREIKGVGLVDLGIFSRNSRVTTNDVEDGLEHTLVAGEIAYDFPAWGEPDVYRDIGNGLNKTREGFGNRGRNGAMFLKADGSVHYFSNAVDIEVLRKLSTRNGGEPTPVDY